MKVTVLGGGSWGTTVAALVAAREPTVVWTPESDVVAEITEQHTNQLYLPGSTLPHRLRATDDMERAVRRADVLFVGVPSAAVRTTVEHARQWVRPWIPIVSLSKGLEAGTLLRMTQVIEELLPGHPAAALTGPNLAREIMAGQATASVIATADPGVGAALQGLLRSQLFRVYRNHDVVGCEVGGALKNVIAIAAGMAEGLGVGDNTRAAVITRGLAELTRLGVAMGAEPQTLAGLAGMGDLIASCLSPYGRNRTVGEQLGRGKKLEEILGETRMVVEGVHTAAVTLELAGRYDIDLPICREIHKVVLGVQTPLEAYRGLRRPGHEADPG